MTKLGYQIANFTYPGIDDNQIISSVIAQSREADTSGFDRVMLMDHFYQLPMIGAPSEPMFECYTLLAAIAQHTSNVRLSALVTGNTYRNPAMLAKEITTLDHVSGGRATLGIGAGWFEAEHVAYGFEFGTFTDRFEKLEEALQIIKPMLNGEQPTLEGKHYQAREAMNSPAPMSKIPIMIGGGGEKKTLRMVAQYADESNLVGLTSPDEVAGKLKALDDHCLRLGRDRSEIKVTMLVPVCIAPSAEEVDDEIKQTVLNKGMDPAMVEMVKSMIVHGTPDQVAEGLSRWMATGLDGLCLSLMFNGHIEGRVRLLGETASHVVA